MSAETPTQPELPISIGDRLRQARENAGLSTQEVADQTRIPRRHVEAIEGNRLTALPSGPYAIGFARAIARIVGYPEEEAANAMRSELARTDNGVGRSVYEAYEPVESSRVPPKALAWTVAIIGLLLVGGYTVWRTMGNAVPVESTTSGTAEDADATRDTSGAGASGAPVNQTAALSGPLVIRATDEVWFGLNDPATGRLAFERTLRAGDSYAVPETQRGLLLRTGRAQHLRLFVGERALPQIGAPDVLVRDISLSPQALSTLAASASNGTSAVATPAPAQ